MEVHRSAKSAVEQFNADNIQQAEAHLREIESASGKVIGFINDLIAVIYNERMMH